MGELHFRFDVLPRKDGGWAYLLFRNGERLWSEGDLVKFSTEDAAREAAGEAVRQLFARSKNLPQSPAA
jgi:hypothetical protein